MLKAKYVYDPETLRFEKHFVPFTQKVKVGTVYFLIIVLIATILRISFDNFIQPPKINHFKLLNQKLKKEYAELNEKIAKAELLLQEVQKRDDKLYRSVFDLAPLPGSVREAGYGGSETSFSGLASNGNISLVNQTVRSLEKLTAKAKIQSGSLSELFAIARSQQKFIASKPSMQPLSPADNFHITSHYGFRADPFTGARRMHQGLDMAGEVGLRVYATGEGTIISAIDARYGYGKEVIVDHGFGYVSRYAHLQKIDVKVGQKIKRGQQIGRLGNSGRSTGPHLHYEVIFENRSLNPRLFYYENLTAGEYEAITTLARK
jgi:murein DD-endopeptidase MepM/ murein hydrolase activator NlpD